MQKGRGKFYTVIWDILKLGRFHVGTKYNENNCCLILSNHGRTLQSTS